MKNKPKIRKENRNAKDKWQSVEIYALYARNSQATVSCGFKVLDFYL